MELVYQYPGKTIKQFGKTISDFFIENINSYKGLCIFGDININSLNDKVNSVKNHLNQIQGFGLTN